ncbi:MAG: cyclic nucleotide-binding domain-containing protein [Patescibacteria group bacterium]
MVDVKLIKNIPVFAGLSPEELNSLASLCLLKKMAVGQKLFKAGEGRKNFYVILSGKLKIYRLLKDEQEVIAYMDKDNFAVESALVDPGLKHTHFGEVMEKGEILEMKGSDFLNLSKNNLRLGNKIYGNIVNNLTERLHHANNKLVTVYSTGKIASTYANIYNLLPLLLETILSVIKAKKAFFALFKPFENKTVIQEAIGFSNNQAIKNLNLGLRGEPFLGKIFENGEDIFVTSEEAKKNKEYKLPYLGENALAVKIQTGQKILGAIVLVDKKEEDFNFNNQILLNIISRQIATALQTAEKTEDQSSHEELKRVYIKPY